MRYNLAVIVTISFMQNSEVLALSTCFYITYIWTIKSTLSRWFKKHFEISCGVQSYDQGLKQLEDYINSTTYLQNVVNEL